MDNIRALYRELNLSVSGESIYNRWKDYREAVTGFVMDGFQSGGSTIVIGAGNMNDLDFEVVSNSSESLVLADIDTASISRYKSAGAKIAEIDFGDFDKVSGLRDPNIIHTFPGNYTPRVKSGLKDEKFNNILISPFYTQLVLPWVFTSFQDLELQKDLLEPALDLACRTIKSANDYIRGIASNNSRLCLWTDMLEYEAQDPAFKDISAHINDSGWMDEFINQYIIRYGHGLGSYGHFEMEETLKNVNHKWLIWPFDSNRSLAVKISAGML